MELKTIKLQMFELTNTKISQEKNGSAGLFFFGNFILVAQNFTQ